MLFTGQKSDTLADTHSYIPDKIYKVTILQTNDIHSERFHSSNSLTMADRKSVIDDIKAEVEGKGGKLILLSGGDINASIENAAASNLQALEYTAMTVSLHQFDYPLEAIRQQQSSAKFPFISANIFESETGKPLFDTYKLINTDGLSIAIMGLTDSPGTQRNKNLVGIHIMDPFKAAAELAPLLKSQADIVIASTHIGHNYMTDSYASRESLSSISDIDLVLGDHTQDDVIKLESDDCGWFLTRIDLEFKNGVLTTTNSEKLSVDSSNTHNDTIISTE